MDHSALTAGPQLPVLSDELLHALDSWVWAQRRRFREQARPLSPWELGELRRYYREDMLNAVSVLSLPDLSAVEPPPLYEAILDAGHAPPIDLGRIRGLTLIDTILIASDRLGDRAAWLTTLFQECVHVCQFERVGSRRFLQDYLESWQCGNDHDSIFLERQAAMLAEYFTARPDRSFSVDEVLDGTVPRSLENGDTQMRLESTAVASPHIAVGYSKRPIRFIRLLSHDGWTIKVYGISAQRPLPPAAMIERAEAIARAALPQPAVTDERHGAAVLIVHEGADGNYILLDWWVGNNMLMQRVYQASTDAPLLFSDFTASGIVACVWELHVLAYERTAWVEQILARPGGPDFGGYYNRRLNADV